MSAQAVRATLARLHDRLLAARETNPNWTGQLSDSALATATAVIALHLADESDPLVAQSLNWLRNTQNTDGGFGDTVKSSSNLSTTALCWAAFQLTRTEGAALERASGYVCRAAGGLEPDTIARALASRYGNDRTFSVPILTVLAVAGIVPWRLVPQLPFELAALPRSWFAHLGLPVVSYALPALIAIGQVRHRKRPAWNPATRLIRRLASASTLSVLRQIQPANGGYLEAAPLTSFVCISLLASGIHDSAVLQGGLGFLRRSARPTGAWPIDTNLAMWTTTLSVNALQNAVPMEDREPITAWLLAQQYRETHPFTGAAPGGWAWTDLPGGVPDADDTPGALLALHTLGVRSQPVMEGAEAGVRWLLDLQNRDGGIPTFCRGWGRLPFDRSAADLTAHTLQAWRAWRPTLSPKLQARVDAAIPHAARFLQSAQRADGAWMPLWFGNQHAPGDENPVYGTARVLLGLRPIQPDSPAVKRGLAWLIATQNKDGGWGGAPGTPSTIEETSLAVAALSGSSAEACRRGAAWIVDATEHGEKTPAAPIGLYFAKLWYFESLYPLIFATDALRRVAATELADS